MSENTESYEITDEEIEGFIDGGEQPSFHPILQVWREVLAPAVEERDVPVSPQWANRITSSYRELNFADMENYRDAYFGKIIELSEILEAEIATDEECFTPAAPEEDAEQNAGHYKNLLRDWQLAVLGWELGWKCTDENAAVELAAISEVHKMFFGPTGITAFLDNIRFEYTEADQSELAAALGELKEGS